MKLSCRFKRLITILVDIFKRPKIIMIQKHPQIHWFSIFNSFMMVIFLVGLVAMILMRTLRKDYQRYSKDDDLDDIERDLGDEYGWKQVALKFT